MNTKQLIGARIKKLRTKQGITQEKLAEKVNINPKYLSSIERGKENPTLNTFTKLAQALDVEMNIFFKLIEVENPAKRKDLIISLIDNADDEQLSLAYKIMKAIVM